MNNCTIFISSSDNYSDIWDVFFDMFLRFWPEYKGEIVLNTQEKDYHHEGLNIHCTKVGRKRAFGETFLEGLKHVRTPNVLLFMIDYMFMGKVNDKAVEEYYEIFLKEDLDTLCLWNQPFKNTAQTSDPRLVRALPPADKILFGFQAAFWKKSVLKEMVLPHENPWMAEWFGSARAAKMKIRLYCLGKDTERPIPYDARGCLHQGKWLDNAVEFLEKYGYKIDFAKRGYYKDNEVYKSFRFRIRLKYMIISTGLKGSYLDLFKRRPIHK